MKHPGLTDDQVPKYDPHEEEDYRDFTIETTWANWIVGVPVGLLIAAVLVFGTYKVFESL